MHPPSHRVARHLGALVGVGALLIGTAGATTASPAPVAKAPTVNPPATSQYITLVAGAFEAKVSRTFPEVLGYRHRPKDTTLGGGRGGLSSIVVNGVSHTVQSTFTKFSGSEARYTLTSADLPGVGIDVSISIGAAGILTWKVTAVRDTPEVRVGTLDIPGLDLLSVSSAQPGATTAFTKIDVDRAKDADVITPVTASTPADPAPVGATYAIVNTDKLAASIETNGTYDQPTDATDMDAGRFWHQARTENGATIVGVTPGQWTVWGKDAPAQSELPWAKVILTLDANADRKVDWQDGAIAFRKIGTVLAGGTEVPDRVIQHIPFNFGSLATHPFLKTLDDVKRLSLATDGLGQFTLLKGYAAEGHDSAHPDYGGNYNIRAGGLTDLNTLLHEGKKWGSTFGVHVNAQEAYPEANAFNETLVNKNAKGWGWLNQSYLINKRRDLTSGDLLSRTAQLRAETDPNLKVLYWDVYPDFGWIPDSMDTALKKQGWQIASEWSYAHERNSLWSHWANDWGYGPSTNKGINSTIIRFIRNGQKDTWNPQPILGSSRIVEAEGWGGLHDWNAMEKNIWSNQLPVKFLQHFDITKWQDHRIDFAGGVYGTDTNDRRQLFVGDAMVLDGSSYLLPWGPTSPASPTKAYHYNADGGTTTWTLAPALRNATSFTVYELTDNGRTKVGTVANVGNKVTLTAKASTPYVLYPNVAPTQATPAYGQGGPIADPGFNDATLASWTKTGTVTPTTLSTGQHQVTLGAGASGISQKVTGLTPGKGYAASAWVEVADGQNRATTVSVAGSGVDAKNTIQHSLVENVVASDELRQTNFQRVRVIFTAPADGTVTFAVNAVDGTPAVRIDDARLVATTEKAVSGNVLVNQDFENVDQGWLPFVSGPAQDGGDAHTSLAKLHAPYTQAGWNGKLADDVLDGTWSLKAHDENTGLIYRTWPGTASFTPGHRYKVEFTYQNAVDGAYSIVVGADQPSGSSSSVTELTRTVLGQQRTNAQYSQEFVAGGCGDYFVGVRRNAVGNDQVDFLIDNVKITDLGADSTPVSCASLAITGPASGLVPGEANVFTSAFTNRESVAVTQVTQTLTAPSGWTVTASTPATFASVAPGATATTTWRVIVPADTPAGTYPISGSTSYQVNGQPRSVTASINSSTLPAGLIPQSRLSIAGVSDSEPGTGDGSPGAAIDGNASTMWHSAWSQVDPDTPYPHWISLDLGDTYTINGFDYQVRVGNGSIKNYELYVSSDNQNWGTAVKTGTFASTAEVQHLSLPGISGRYVKLVGLSSINGAVFAGANELNVWGSRAGGGVLPLPKGGMTVTDADSEETEGEDGSKSNAIDGDTATFWHTQWLATEAPYPHYITVDMGASHTLTGITIQGRTDGAINGRIKDYEVYVSADGSNWGSPAATGSLASSTAAQPVNFTTPATGRFVKVVGKNAINGLAFAAIAELDFFERPASTP